MRRSATWLSTVLLTGFVVAGCGDASSPDDGAPAPAATTTRPTIAEAATIAISRPADGSRLRARTIRAGGRRAATRVRGSAGRGSSVFLTASCRPARCDARATAGRDGRWEARLTLTTTRAARFVTIDARAGAQASAPVLAVATVQLVAPRPRAAGGTAERGSGGGGETASRGGGGSGVGGGETGAGGGGGAETEGGATGGGATTPSRSRPLPRDVLVIGDSLAIGMTDPLRAALPGWKVRVDARIGRPLAEGMRILDVQSDPPALIAFSLFTNDDPRATAALERAVRATATRRGACVVWATVVRPPYQGVPYTAANRLLERLRNDPGLASGLRIVDWRAAVARVPSYLAGDGVHATPAGYRALGRLYAGAIRTCAGRD